MLLGEHKAKTLEYGQSEKMYFHHLVVKHTNIDIKTSDANRGAELKSQIIESLFQRRTLELPLAL